MKDIIISGDTVKKEINILIVSFSVALIMDILAIIFYKKPFYEVFQTIGYIITITLAIYLITWTFRLIISLIKKLISLFPKHY